MSKKKTIALGGTAFLVMIVLFIMARMHSVSPPAARQTHGRESQAVHEGLSKPVYTPANFKDSLMSGPDKLDVAARMEKLNSMLMRMHGKNYDTKPVLQELKRRLKESPDGKLSREEINRILPRDMAKDFAEFMAVIQSEPGGGRL